MKKLIFALGLLFLCSNAWARTATFDGGGGADPLASTATNWDTDTAPIAGDVVVFDATSSNNCTWDITATIASINTTGYTGLVTASVTMTVGGSITFADNTFAHGNQTVIINATSTLTTGTTNPFYNLTFSGNYTQTISGIVQIDHTWKPTATISTIALTGGTIYAKGDIDASAGGLSWSTGTVTEVVVNGSSAQTITGRTGGTAYVSVGGNLTLSNTSGGVTFVGTFDLCKNLTHTTGSVSFGTSTVFGSSYSASTHSITSNGTLQFYKLWIHQTRTYTFVDDATVINELDLAKDGVGTSTLNGSKIYLQGDFKNTDGNQVTGSTGIEFTGSASQTWSQANTTYIILATGTMNINKSGGTLSVSGAVRFDGTIVHTAGAVDTATGTSTLTIVAAKTMNTGSGMSWYNIAMGANITMGSDLQFSNNFTRTAGAVSGAYFLKPTGATTHVIDGTNTISGFDCASGETCSFDDADIFTITNGKGNGTWQSDDATNTVDIDFTAETISSGAGTRVDSAGGVAVTTTGTITSCVNWSAPSTRKLIMVVA